MSNRRHEFLFSWLFPELKLFANRSDRRQAIGVAFRKSGFWSTALIMIWGLPQIFVDRWLAARFSYVNELLIMIPVVLLMVCAMAYIPVLIYTKSIRRSLREQLNALGTMVCMQCGYQLCGLTIHRCPECGTPFIIQQFRDKDTEDSVSDSPGKS